MEAMEDVEEMGDHSNQSVRAIAKLADSDQVIIVQSIPVATVTCSCTCGYCYLLLYNYIKHS